MRVGRSALVYMASMAPNAATASATPRRPLIRPAEALLPVWMTPPPVVGSVVLGAAVDGSLVVGVVPPVDDDSATGVVAVAVGTGSGVGVGSLVPVEEVGSDGVGVGSAVGVGVGSTGVGSLVPVEEGVGSGVGTGVGTGSGFGALSHTSAAHIQLVAHAPYFGP